MTHKFQKLNIDLPRQPLSDQKVWMVAGWLIAVFVILIAVYSYLDYKNGSGASVEQTIESSFTGD
jgi:hypothetical protein